MRKEDLTPYDLRRTFATWYLAENPEGLRDLAELLGHSDLTQVMEYALADEKRAQSPVRRIGETCSARTPHGRTHCKWCRPLWSVSPGATRRPTGGRKRPRRRLLYKPREDLRTPHRYSVLQHSGAPSGGVTARSCGTRANPEAGALGGPLHAAAGIIQRDIQVREGGGTRRPPARCRFSSLAYLPAVAPVSLASFCFGPSFASLASPCSEPSSSSASWARTWPLPASTLTSWSVPSCPATSTFQTT